MAEAPSRLIALSPVASAEHTRHHIALRLLPFVFVLYIANYLDRTQCGIRSNWNGARSWIQRSRFRFGHLFLSYVSSQIPGAALAQRWSAHGMIAATMIVSGLLTGLTGLVHTPAQLYFARFLLGTTEAGFFPSVIVYLSHWFIHEDRAKATSNFMAAIPLSLIIGSPVAGWMLDHNWFTGWCWLFFLEGVPAILLGIAAFFFLADCPHEATWLTPEQRQWISRRLEEETPAERQSVSSWKALRSRILLE